MMHPRITPPRWAERFLEWYCRPEVLEDLQGDLNEYFIRHCKSKSVRQAKLIYILDVLKFLRPYTLRKPEFLNLLIHWIMIGSYVKTSGRSIVRNKLFSAINIIGLAISMSVGLLMIAFLNDLLSYDDIHKNKDRIYRVINDYQGSRQGTPQHLASTSLKAGRLIKESVTGIEEVTMMRRGFGGDARVGNKTVPLEGLYAEDNFFNVFSFKMLAGDTRTALKEPFSIVLTEKSAKKLFGDEDALGQSIKFHASDDTSDYVVTGIIEDIPKFSHLQFEGLMSHATYETQEKDAENFMLWRNMWSDYIYLLLPENADIKAIQSHLDKISADQNKTADEDVTITMHLQPLKEIALGPDLSNQVGPTMMVDVVYIVAGLAFIVILSAGFNYTNLSIARSLRRSREVGIRKVIGALKSHVLGQFIAEAIMISLLALIFSIFLFLFIRPQFFEISPVLGQIVTLDLSPKLLGIFVIFAVMVGVGAGFLPALFFSRINAIQVLKDVTSMRVFRNVNMRKALIVVQYTFSLIFITATIIGYRQYKHALSFDLGFTTANVVNIQLQGNKAELLEKPLREFPEIEAISRSLMITSVGTEYGSQMKYKTDSVNINFNIVNEHYLPLHDHKLIAGRNFTPQASNSAVGQIVVNEKAVKELNIKDAASAVGETVEVDDEDFQIVGVMKDFHYGKIDSEIRPVVYQYSDKQAGYLNLKITSTDWPATLGRIESAWKKIDEVHPLKATFYDDQIEEAYNEFSAMIKIIGFMAFLAISIASLGLLGMVVFTTETRLKEISIRKVLGASEGNLIFILSRGFFVLLLIAAFIALPLTYLFFEKVVLAEIVYHAPIGFGELFISVIVVMGIALIMIGSQTLKVARSNPAEVLKTE
jgi:putative ABC transport system permease protein